jgi:eukaryotic-like serine/threonine-protein kinase
VATRQEDVRAIFESAVDIDSPGERAAYLERRCAADGELRRRVESLLAAHAMAGGFLARPAAEATGPFAPDSDPLPPGASVLRALGALLPSVPRVQLREPATEVITPVVRPGSAQMPSAAEPAGRLQLYGEIARGGMGAVLKGRDTDLGRDVAVKVLLRDHAGRAELVQRFVEEAQIAGQLQHPGITPVYEMGQLADRRPYFTMKLLKGQTLAALLAAARKDPAEDQARYVGVFLQVCQTLSYAHARGVIHRDLKPSNVMLGAFGEVQVMDWGLAKVLAQGGAADEARARAPAERSVIRTARQGSGGTPGGGPDTQAGTLLGTPGYMAPEQAQGDVDLVDERADVFGLGAILCEILTGQPPFAGRHPEAARWAQQGRLEEAFTRLEGCGADGPLVALAKRCLAAQPWDRPRHAGEVADQLTAYQDAVAERMRRAELGRAAAEARAVEERKRRRVLAALAVAVLTLVGVGAGGGLLVQHQAAQRREDQARRDAEKRQQVEAALDKAATLREQARWGEARAVLDQARGVLGDVRPDDLRRRLDLADAEVALVNRLDAIRQRRATLLVGRHFDTQTAEGDYATAFKESGLGEVGDEEGAVAERVRASGVSEPLVAALDDWAHVTEKPESLSWLLRVARLANPDPWGDRFRQPPVWQDRETLMALADEALRDDGAKLDQLSPQVLVSLGVLLGVQGGDPLPLLRAAQRRYPKDFWLSLRLGNRLLEAKQYEEGVGYFRVAVALRPDASVAHTNLGVALYDEKDLDGAVAEYRQAIKLDPKFSLAHSNLGSLLTTKGDGDAAIAECRKAIELDPTLAAAHFNLGKALRKKENLDGAIAEFRRASELDLRDADAHNNLGDILGTQGDEDGAIAEFRKAIELAPKHAIAHFNLGLALSGKKDQEGAIAAYRKATELDPKCLLAHENLGSALYGQKDLDGAIAAYRKATELDPNYPEAHCNLGKALVAQGRFTQALGELRRGHALGSQRPGWPYPSADWVREGERLLALDEKLSAILDGPAQPADVAEQVALAQLCQRYKRRPAAAARFYSAAFAADPGLAADLQQQHRYNAACAAALAAAGQGDDAKALPDKAQRTLQHQALGWLRADLAIYATWAERPEPAAKQAVRQLLGHWQEDADLASVRDKPALAKLPEDEREAWAALWADVGALLRKVPEKPK